MSTNGQRRAAAPGIANEGSRRAGETSRPGAVANAALWSGSIASIATMAVLAYSGRRQRGSALAPANAPSHWLWQDEALRQRGFTLRHTVPGYLIHHTSSVFWAVFFEHLLLDRPHRAARTAAVALIVAAVAAGVDLKLTPKRLTPGFERQLGPRALAVMYGVFGLALYAAHALRRRLAGSPVSTGHGAATSGERMRGPVANRLETDHLEQP